MVFNLKNSQLLFLLSSPCLGGDLAGRGGVRSPERTAIAGGGGGGAGGALVCISAYPKKVDNFYASYKRVDSRLLKPLCLVFYSYSNIYKNYMYLNQKRIFIRTTVSCILHNKLKIPPPCHNAKSASIYCSFHQFATNDPKAESQSIKLKNALRNYENQLQNKKWKR